MNICRPTDLFTILELKSPSHDVPELPKIRRSPDREALKLWKGPSGRVTGIGKSWVSLRKQINTCTCLSRSSRVASAWPEISQFRSLKIYQSNNRNICNSSCLWNTRSGIPLAGGKGMFFPFSIAIGTEGHAKKINSNTRNPSHRDLFEESEKHRRRFFARTYKDKHFSVQNICLPGWVL